MYIQHRLMKLKHDNFLSKRLLSNKSNCYLQQLLSPYQFPMQWGSLNTCACGLLKLDTGDEHHGIKRQQNPAAIFSLSYQFPTYVCSYVVIDLHFLDRSFPIFPPLQSFYNTETLSKLRADIIHRLATDLQVKTVSQNAHFIVYYCVRRQGFIE